MTAQQITRLLEQRHAKDVFVPQCKMGAAGSRVLDGWALLPTWSPLTTIGYEIKVSRSDWLQDQKFEDYRACCHLFLVVAPRKIVAATELPSGVGLLEPVGEGDGQRLVMRAKPVRQEPNSDKLVRLMAHALMWRKGIGEDNLEQRERRLVYWQHLVDQQDRAAALGRAVKGRMRGIIHDALTRASEAESKANALYWTAEVLTELGIRPGYNKWSARRTVRQALGRDAEAVKEAVGNAMSALRQIQEAIA